jgi:hypothetical protein
MDSASWSPTASDPAAWHRRGFDLRLLAADLMTRRRGVDRWHGGMLLLEGTQI